MNGEQLLEKMELIDPAFVMEAEAKPKKRTFNFAKWVAVACLCLVVGPVLLGGLRDILRGENSDFTTSGNVADDPSVAFGFCIDGDESKLYFPISYEERRLYGLLQEGDAIGQSLRVYEADIGEFAGTVTACGNENIIGCKVYRYSKYPELDSIRILETPSGYAFYCCTWLMVEAEEGGSIDSILEAYGLPESMARMEVCAPDFSYLYDIEDSETIASVWEILSGKINMGHEAGERSFARVWFEVYGTESVYYSEEDGHCVFKGGSELYEKAHELWNEGEYIIVVTTAQGFRLSFDYLPAVGMFVAGNGYYGLNAEDVEALSALLER